jgi:hypothetical protein
MANYSTLEHSKTLGKTQVRNFSTLDSTLGGNEAFWADLFLLLIRVEEIGEPHELCAIAFDAGVLGTSPNRSEFFREIARDADVPEDSAVA